VRRTPRWVFIAGAGFLIIAVAVALVHKPRSEEHTSELQSL
jgi:hypothetical protein